MVSFGEFYCIWISAGYYVHPFQKHVIDRIASAFMSTKSETRGEEMGPIRGLELSLSSDAAGLGQSMCVCVGGFSAGSVGEVMRKKKERPGNPLFLFWCQILLEAG